MLSNLSCFCIRAGNSNYGGVEFLFDIKPGVTGATPLAVAFSYSSLTYLACYCCERTGSIKLRVKMVFGYG